MNRHLNLQRSLLGLSGLDRALAGAFDGVPQRLASIGTFSTDSGSAARQAPVSAESNLSNDIASGHNAVAGGEVSSSLVSDAAGAGHAHAKQLSDLGSTAAAAEGGSQSGLELHAGDYSIHTVCDAWYEPALRCVPRPNITHCKGSA